MVLFREQNLITLDSGVCNKVLAFRRRDSLSEAQAFTGRAEVADPARV
jgi:hypothetical protein